MARRLDPQEFLAELTRFWPYLHAATDVIQGDDMKILGLGIGTGTQDILLFDSTKLDFVQEIDQGCVSDKR